MAHVQVSGAGRPGIAAGKTTGQATTRRPMAAVVSRTEAFQVRPAELGGDLRLCSPGSHVPLVAKGSTSVGRWQMALLDLYRGWLPGLPIGHGRRLACERRAVPDGGASPIEADYSPSSRSSASGSSPSSRGASTSRVRPPLWGLPITPSSSSSSISRAARG